MLKLPIYTDETLQVGLVYTTIEVAGEYFPDNDIVQLINDNNQVRATGKIVKSLLTKFDHIGSPDLRNIANSHMRSWTNAAQYFIARFGEAFSYAGDVQIITFEVQSNMRFDVVLEDAQEDEIELGIPSDEELGIVLPEAREEE